VHTDKGSINEMLVACIILEKIKCSIKNIPHKNKKEILAKKQPARIVFQVVNSNVSYSINSITKLVYCFSNIISISLAMLLVEVLFFRFVCTNSTAYH
jgi:hypothetical protein